MNNTFKVNYLARDFSTIKEELKNYAKRYYADTLADLSDANINSFMIESVAYVGDILSYYLDYQTNETFLATAIERRNIINLAKSLGYKEQDNTTATGKVAIYVLIPDNGKLEPDYSKAPIIRRGSQLTSTSNNIYTITEDVIIDNTLIGLNYVPTRINTFGNPTYYAVKVYAPIISGEIKQKTISIDNFIPFRKIYLDDLKIVEIVDILDSDFNEYYEVPNLSQNIVYKSVLNYESEPKYVLKPITAQRRFIFGHEEGVPYIIFGGKQYKPDEELDVNPIIEPSKFVLNKYNNDHLSDKFFEPNHLTNGDLYGIGPEKTTLTITYRVNTSANNNAAIAEISNTKNLIIEFPTNLSDTDLSIIRSSIQVVNEEPIIGQNVSMGVNELKDLAGSIYSAQNRAVTSKDYETLCYMMPQKYGSVKRVKAYRDPTSMKNNINLYVACVSPDGTLAPSNFKIKENLKTWLSEYKIITDTVDIMDAKIINFGIHYTILVDPNADKSSVIVDVSTHLKNVFLNKPNIGESFNILDVYREIRKHKFVLDIKEVKIKNIVGLNYSVTPFNIEANVTSDGNVIKIPKNAIFEIKYPDLDIIGNAL